MFVLMYTDFSFFLAELSTWFQVGCVLFSFPLKVFSGCWSCLVDR